MSKSYIKQHTNQVNQFKDGISIIQTLTQPPLDVLKQFKFQINIWISELDGEIRNVHKPSVLSKLKALQLKYKKIVIDIEEIEKEHLYKSNKPIQSQFLLGTGTTEDPFIVSPLRPSKTKSRRSRTRSQGGRKTKRRC
jgi:hypothetical protein